MTGDTPPAPRLAAVLWDMDGTLVDTEPYWLDVERELVESFGGTWTKEHGLQLVGSALERSAHILQSFGVDMETWDLIRHISGRVTERLAVEIPWRPGARELLAELREARVPTALVTMSISPMAHSVIAAIGFDAFDVVVAGDQVERPKPHPDPYLQAASALGVDIARCVAIEDSIPGTTSASASGAATVAVPAHVPLPPSPSYTLWESLEGRGVADLEAVLAERAELSA